MSLQSEMETLFASYLRAWNARDFDAIAAFFSEPIVYVLASGPLCLPDRAAFIAMLKQQFADLEALGFDHTEIGSIRARQCNDTTAMVDLRDVRRLRADGSPLEVIDAIYVCIRDRDGWKLSIAMGCWPNWSTAPGVPPGAT